MNNPVSPSPIGQPKKPFNAKLVVIIIGAAILVGAGVFAAMYPWGTDKVGNVAVSQTPAPTQTLTPTPSTSQTADETADWQTYIWNEGKLQFKYPVGWQVKKEYYSTAAQAIKGESPTNIGLTLFRDQITADAIKIGGVQESCEPSQGHTRCGFIARAPVFTNSKNSETLKIFDAFVKTVGELSAVNTAGWQTYRNEKYGFEVKIPGGLTQVDRSTDNNLSVEIKDNKLKTGDDGFSSDTAPPYKKFPNWSIFLYHNSGDKCIFNSGEEEKQQGLSFENTKVINGTTFYVYANYPKYIGAYCGMSSGCTYEDIYRVFYKNTCYQIQLNRNEAAFASDSNKTTRYLEQFNQLFSTFKFTK